MSIAIQLTHKVSLACKTLTRARSSLRSFSCNLRRLVPPSALHKTCHPARPEVSSFNRFCGPPQFLRVSYKFAYLMSLLCKCFQNVVQESLLFYLILRPLYNVGRRVVEIMGHLDGTCTSMFLKASSISIKGHLKNCLFIWASLACNGT